MKAEATVARRYGVRELPIERIRQLAWIGGFMYAVTGGSGFLVAIAAGDRLDHPTAMPVGCVVAALLGLGLMAMTRLLPDATLLRAYPPLTYGFLFLPGVGITIGLYFAGAAFTIGSLVYLVAPIFGVYLFPRPVAAVQIAAIGVEYAVLLATQDGVTAPIAQWTFLMAMTGTVAVFTGRFIEDADRVAASERQARLELAEASKQKSAFLAAMSHELRTPLNAIIGFSEVLKERIFGELNEKQSEYVGDVVGSGQHLLALINDILDLSKVEAGRMELAVGEVDVATLVESAVALVRPDVARSGIALTVELDPEVGTMDADEQKLRQVLINLLSNAVKFTPDRGAIKLATSRANGSVVISISDSGPGIGPEDHDRIFEEFAQAGPAVTGRQPGTGLGLALARRFAELHQGRLTVHSDLGRGATFRLEVPAP